MKKLIAMLAMLATGLINAGSLLPAPEFHQAIKIPDKATAVACDYGAIKAAVRLGLITPAPSIIGAVAGCSGVMAVKYSAKLNKEGMK